MWRKLQHSYEEIREVVIEILLGHEAVRYEPDQYGHLSLGVAEVFERRESKGAPQDRFNPTLHPNDLELVRDVFWDLFRQGTIILGKNDSNPTWPFFRLSHTGKQTLASSSPYRFHNTASYLNMIKTEVPDMSPEAIAYLDEAVATFYADCRLASCVMLGVAAEAEFLRLVEVAAKSAKYGVAFSAAPKEKFIRSKVTKFQAALKPIIPALVPKAQFEDVDTNLSLIQSVLRVARNNAGHPTSSSPPSREQVYVFLQMFVPFARQLMHLRVALQ